MRLAKTAVLSLAVAMVTHAHAQAADPFSKLFTQNATTEFMAPQISCLSLRCFDNNTGLTLDNFLQADVSSSGVKARAAFGVQGGSFSHNTPLPPSLFQSSARVVAPTISAGCNGIDMNFGSLQFAFDMNFSVESFRAIIQASGYYFVQLAMASITPLIQGIAAKIEEQLNTLSMFEKDSCELANGIATRTFESVGGERLGNLTKGVMEKLDIYDQPSEVVGPISNRSSSGLTSKEFLDSLGDKLTAQQRKEIQALELYQYINTTGLAIYGTMPDHEAERTIVTKGLLGFKNNISGSGAADDPDAYSDYTLFHDFLWRLPYKLIYAIPRPDCGAVPAEDIDRCAANNQSGTTLYDHLTVAPSVQVYDLVNGFERNNKIYRPIDINPSDNLWNVGIYGDNSPPAREVTYISAAGSIARFPGYKDILSSRFSGEENLFREISTGNVNISELTPEDRQLLSIMGNRLQQLIVIATLDPDQATSLVADNIAIFAHIVAVEDIMAHANVIKTLLQASIDRIPVELELQRILAQETIKEINEYVAQLQLIENDDIRDKITKLNDDLDKAFLKSRALLPSLEMLN